VNREQKAAAIDEIAGQIQESEAVYAVDYRGISVPQAAELRTRLRDADTTFRIVKNTLTERAADKAGAESLKPLLQGPTALAFVRGDAAIAAKALRDYARTTDELLPFKGGLLNGDALDADQIRSIAQLPSRDVLIAQLVGVTASPITGLVRGLGALIGGLAVALGAVRDKKESGELPAGDPPAQAAAPEQPEAPGVPAEGADPDADDPDAGPASGEGATQDVQPDQAEGDDAPADTDQTDTQED
jgi:large subunit ribosomal protein L10